MMNVSESIFVSVVSYRDIECQWTVKSAFEQASHPEKIHFGICFQYNPDADQNAWSMNSTKILRLLHAYALSGCSIPRRAAHVMRAISHSHCGKANRSFCQLTVTLAL
eukprot:205892_1